ncbi:tellurite resistance methyltransferase TehB [Lysobacteraceae bacterium NML75-0749]|nr:tellurite resistance methyltransferase TehB [Xanthomonadaceae bacterium NML75-0749]
MNNLIIYKTMPEWTQDTLPKGFLHNHNTQEGTWAQLQILAGSLDFAITDSQGNTLEHFTFSPENQPPLIEPKQWHRIVSASTDMRCRLHFMCTPEDYPAKKYKLSRAHSEVVEALPRLDLPANARALDVGCGRGRNSLYLALHGLRVDGIDRNFEALQTLAEIIATENLGERIRLAEADFNQAGQQSLLQGSYDLILSTVVLMFLQADAARALIAQMQATTAPGGYNLIVSAMDTDDYPCTQPFPFTLREGELSAMYQGWELFKYNENPGHLHKTDAEGNPIALRFATLLARKPQ